MDDAVYEQLKTAEQKHWWCVGRRAILADVIARVIEGGKARALDIGCGLGFNAKILGTKAREVIGIESSRLAIEAAAKVNPGLKITKGIFPNVPLEGTFDIITMFDVLEHCDDDVATLEKIKTILTPKGTIVLTVPAFKWLWTEHDNIVQHKRRYTRKELATKLENAGFTIQRATYFNTLLFPAIVALRMWRKIWGIKQETSDYALPSPIFNAIFKKIFSCEKYLLRYYNLPIGVSILCIATTVVAKKAIADPRPPSSPQAV